MALSSSSETFPPVQARHRADRDVWVQPLLATIVALFLSFLGGRAPVDRALAPPAQHHHHQRPARQHVERLPESYREAPRGARRPLKIVPPAVRSTTCNTSPRRLRRRSRVRARRPRRRQAAAPGLVSLGSIAYQPLWSSSAAPTGSNCSPRLAGAHGIGAPGSGVQMLARALLEANGITGAADHARRAAERGAGQDFLAGKLDAIFLMGRLGAGRHAPLAPPRARGASLRLHASRRLRAPARHVNLHKSSPARRDRSRRISPRPTYARWPRRRIVARRGLNSAISDLLLKVAQQWHGKPNLFAKRDEFPAALGHEFRSAASAPVSTNPAKASRMNLVESFWLANSSTASRRDRAYLLVLIPAIRSAVAYRWSVHSGFTAATAAAPTERDAGATLTAEQVAELLDRLTPSNGSQRAAACRPRSRASSTI